LKRNLSVNFTYFSDACSSEQATGEWRFYPKDPIAKFNQKVPIPITKFNMRKQDGEDAERHRGVNIVPALKKMSGPMAETRGESQGCEYSPCIEKMSGPMAETRGESGVSE
jgi:hypothetical protein